MRIRDENRGKHMAEKAEINRKKVVSYFTANPSSTLRDAAFDLGMSVVTVRNHIRAHEAGK